MKIMNMVIKCKLGFSQNKQQDVSDDQYSDYDDETSDHFQQVAYLGLLENVRVRRAGFAYRQEYSRFLRRSEAPQNLQTQTHRQQTQTIVFEIPQQVRVSTASTDTDKTQDTDTNADTDKSTPDSSEGQRLHRILRHRKDYLRFHRRSDSPQIPQTQIHGNKRRHRQEYSRFLRESPTKIVTDIFALPGTR